MTRRRHRAAQQRHAGYDNAWAALAVYDPAAWEQLCRYRDLLLELWARAWDEAQAAAHGPGRTLEAVGRGAGGDPTPTRLGTNGRIADREARYWRVVCKREVKRIRRYADQLTGELHPDQAPAFVHEIRTGRRAPDGTLTG